MKKAKKQKPRLRPVDPPALTGKESARQILETCFPAYAGRGMREAHRLMRASIERDCSVFMTLSGAMTPAGMHQSCIIPLIKAGFVSCLTTTGANLYHDLHRTLGYLIHEVNPFGSDTALRRERIIRIYDVGFDENVLLDTDQFFATLLRSEPFQRSMTTVEFHNELGRAVAALEKERGIETPSLLSTCWRYGVPIFVGAPQDGSIYLNVVRLEREDPEGFKFRLDIGRDVYTMAAVQNWARKDDGEAAIWIIGGGVPKNYTLQGEPLLSQILFVDARGFDIDVQICIDVADNGALSSCTAGEGHTWGKTSIECVESDSVYLRSDVTVALPILTEAILSDKSLRRKPRRLYDDIPAAVAHLDELWLKKSKKR